MKRLFVFFKILLSIIVLFFVFIYAVTFNSQLGWVILLLMILFFLLNSLSLLGSLKHMSINPISAINTQVNEKKTVYIELENQKKRRVFFPILIIKNETLNLNYRLVLFFKRKQQISINWLATERLFVENLEFELISTDLFGLFKKSKLVEVPTKIYVLPAHQSNGNSILDLLNSEMKQAMFGEATFDLEKIRLYQFGDPVKQIDWKLSSKKQELIFKEYEMYESADILFLFYGVRSFYYERMLNLFFSLYQEIDKKEYSFRLMGNNIDKEKVLDILDFAKIKGSDDPGEIPSFKEEYLIIFTPEKTGSLIRNMSKIDARKKIQIIEFKEIERSLS